MIKSLWSREEVVIAARIGGGESRNFSDSIKMVLFGMKGEERGTDDGSSAYREKHRNPSGVGGIPC